MSEKQAQKIRDRIFKAMDKAIDNYKGAEKSETATSTRNSLDAEIDNLENKTRFALDVDANGKKFVNIQENIIDGITDDKQIKEYVKEYMKEYLPTLNMLGFDLPVNAKSRREFTNSKYTRMLQRKLHDLFLDKMRIVANLEEVVSVADGYSWEVIKKSRKDNALGFVHGKIQIRVGNNDYVADVVLENLSDKGLIFYDIVDMCPTKIKAAKRQRMVRKSNTADTMTTSNSILPSSQNNATTTSSDSDIENIQSA